MDCIRIEDRTGSYAVILNKGGDVQEMDRRDTLREARSYAYYLAVRLKLDVYYKGEKLD